MITVSLLLIWRVPETRNPRVQCPTLIWAAFSRLGPPNKTPVWIKSVQNMGYTKHVGPEHLITATHSLFYFYLAVSLHTQNLGCFPQVLAAYFCMCSISHCIYILTWLFYVERHLSNHCCHWEACILAFTDIILIACYVLDGYFG